MITNESLSFLWKELLCLHRTDCFILSYSLTLTVAHFSFSIANGLHKGLGLALRKQCYTLVR